MRFLRRIPTDAAVLIVVAAVLLVHGTLEPRPAFPVDDTMLVWAPQLTGPFDLRLLKTVFTVGTHTDYYPVRDLSYALDHALFGGWLPGLYLHQLLLFCEGVVLLFALLRTLGCEAWPTLAIVSVWSLNPAHSELIHWLAARKDLLALVYGGYATLAFLHALRLGSLPLYALSVAAYGLSLLSKASLIPLPWAGLGVCILYRDRLPRSARPWLAIGSASAVAAAAAAFSSWFYSQVNDMRVPRPLATRLELAAAAFARETGGWLFPSWNGIDFPNLGHWLQLHSWLILPGFLAWFLIAALAAVAIVLRSRQGLCLLGLFALLLVPASGLLFPHRNIYSVRYLEPSMGVAALGLGLAARSPWAARFRRAAFGLALALAAVSAYASLHDARLWRDPRGVFARALDFTPASVDLKTAVLDFGADATFSAELDQELWRTCLSEPAREGDLRDACVNYWVRALIQGPPEGADDRLVQGFPERISASLQSTHVDSRFRLLFEAQLSLLRPDPDPAALAAWDASCGWKTRPELRIMAWITECLSGRPVQARGLLRRYLSERLLRPENLGGFLLIWTNEAWRPRLDACRPAA